jgi:hypothetical protein
MPSMHADQVGFCVGATVASVGIADGAFVGGKLGRAISVGGKVGLTVGMRVGLEVGELVDRQWLGLLGFKWKPSTQMQVSLLLILAQYDVAGSHIEGSKHSWT